MTTNTTPTQGNDEGREAAQVAPWVLATDLDPRTLALLRLADRCEQPIQDLLTRVWQQERDLDEGLSERDPMPHDRISLDGRKNAVKRKKAYLTQLLKELQTEQHQILTPGRVTIDESVYSVPTECLVSSWRWNGFAVPYFTKEQGLQLIARWLGGPKSQPRYDEAADAFVYPAVPEETGMDEDEVFLGADYTFLRPDGTTYQRHLYGIGGGGWTWDTVDEGEENIPHF